MSSLELVVRQAKALETELRALDGGKLWVQAMSVDGRKPGARELCQFSAKEDARQGQ